MNLIKEYKENFKETFGKYNQEKLLDLININPSMDKYFESVINSLFKNYIHFDSSKVLKELVI